MRFPVLSLFPGDSPAHEQICSAVLKQSMSVPISAIMAMEAVALIPGMVMSCSIYADFGEASLSMAVSTSAR